MTRPNSPARASFRKALYSLHHHFSLLGRQRCALCLGHTTHMSYALCRECDRELPRINDACSQCALPLPVARRSSQNQTERLLCGRCISNPPSYDCCLAALEYCSPANELIPRLKYANQFSNAHLLAALMAQHLLLYREPRPWPEAMLPMPLHWRRKISRGFNQSDLIARCLERQLRSQAGHAPNSLNYGLAKRIVHTDSQAGKTEKQRLRNMRGVFAVRPDTVPRTVAIIDDVVTTGATVNELARQLKKAGVERVEVWCAARTLTPGDNCR